MALIINIVGLLGAKRSGRLAAALMAYKHRVWVVRRACVFVCVHSGVVSVLSGCEKAHLMGLTLQR